METNTEPGLTINEMARASHENSKAKGFWEMGVENRNRGELICLMHSELSELLEAIRKKDAQPSEHCPEITAEAEELADVLIRVGDYAHAFGVDLERAVRAKTAFNSTRPYKHSKKF